MRTRKKFLRTALTLTVGTLLITPVSIWSMDADDAPDSVTIDSMAKFYKPVEFDHSKHVGYASCEECHHHTTGDKVADPNCARCHANSPEGDTVACYDCHAVDRFSEKYLKSLDGPAQEPAAGEHTGKTKQRNQKESILYHIDKPGLKGAYHLNCISCHVATSGPTGCQECHEMTEAGKELFHTGVKSSASGQKH